jgi:hypothetical protein
VSALLSVPRVLARVFAITSFGAVTSELVGISFTGIPVGYLTAGRLVRVKLWGVSTNIAAASTLTLRLRMGTGAVNGVGGAASSNAVIASVALTTAAAAKTTVPWSYETNAAIYTLGATGSALGQIGYSGGPAGAVVQAGVGLTAAATVNTTVANNLDFTIQPGNSTDITQTSVHGGSIELL